ncbi:60s ribosomal protein l37a [Stylonychia lemnae]|uniref:60s ribosomal protein l37a n=2 Tax=Eukaryota TaxID=2759 RepID=A0A078ANJ1_STYLE|nr:60s ribosomal protein l37a [Stylonychia lemnae]|eukprot:CDW83744.1 60s ribosomal protein l37a [Stylonychia lemnae]
MNSREDTIEESFRNSKSAPLFTHDDDEEDFKASSDIIQQHRANIARFAQQLGLNLNDESKSEIVQHKDEVADDDVEISFNKTDTSKRKIQELEQQMNLIEDFDSSKYKQKLQAISKTRLRIPKKVKIYRVISRLSSQSESINKIYKRIIMTTRIGEESLIKLKRGLTRNNKYAADTGESNQDFNFKSILMKYSDHRNLNLLNDLSSDNMTSFRSDLEPIDAHSPKLQSLKRGNKLMRENESQDEDETLARIRQKYLGANSPEQQKDSNLRRSSEKVLTESLSQADYLKKSQELINSSLDDLLSNFKNKFYGLNPQNKNDKLQFNQDNRGIQLRQSQNDKKYLNTQGSIDEEKNEDDSIQNRSQKIEKLDFKKAQLDKTNSRDSSLDESFKHSPRILQQALKDSSPIQNRDSGKKIPPTSSIRKSKEKMSLPKSSENKSILIDQFVNKPQQIVVPNLNLSDLQSSQVNQTQKDINQNDDQTVKLENQKFDQESTIQNYDLSESQIDMSKQFINPDATPQNYTLEITEQKLNNQKARINDQSPVRYNQPQIGLKKMTPIRSNKKQKIQIPKYEQAFNAKATFDDEEDDLYKRDFMDIQDTLKTIKQMNLLGSPGEDFKAEIDKELNPMKHSLLQSKPNIQTYNSNVEDQPSLIENQEIDYNLSDDSDDNELRKSSQSPQNYNTFQQQIQRETSQQILKKKQNVVLNQLRAVYRKENRHLLEEDQISFMSSSDASRNIVEDRFLERSLNQGILEFKDNEIPLLMNMLPLAQTLEIKAKEKSLISLLKQVKDISTEGSLEDQVSKIKDKQDRMKQQLTEQDNLKLIKLIEETQNEMITNRRLLESNKLNDMNLDLVEQKIQLLESERQISEKSKLISSMRNSFQEIQSKLTKRLNEINHNFISINEQSIKIQTSLDHQLRNIIQPEQLAIYINDAIIPILLSYQVQIRQQDSEYQLKLLDRYNTPEEIEVNRFIEVLINCLNKAFENEAFTNTVLQNVVQHIAQLDQNLAQKLQSMNNEPKVQDILLQLTLYKKDKKQSEVEAIINNLERIVKDPSVCIYSDLLVQIKSDMTQEMLIQVLVKYYYLFKEFKSLKENEQVLDLRLWNLSKDLIDAIYQNAEESNLQIGDDLLKIIGKIEFLCIQQEQLKFQGHYDHVIHTSIRNIKKLERLDSKNVLKNVAENVQQLMTNLESFSRNEINDISIDSNDQLNHMMEKLIEIPQLFENQNIDLYFIEKNVKAVQRLYDLRSLYQLGLRDITEKVLSRDIHSFTYDEIERIVEARFEDTQLRQIQGSQSLIIYQYIIMAKRTKKVGIVGKYATRYGAAQRKTIKKFEITQRATYTCSFCGKDSVKRSAVGIWRCRACKKVLAGGAWQVSTAAALTAKATVHRLRRLREEAAKETAAQ